MTKKKKEYEPDFKDGAKFKKGKPVHKIGRHGTVGLETPDGSICAECFKPIKR